MTAKRIAVMQPYFFPYAGYFRLFALVDEFVIFDCVQFPRRGRVHRTEVPAPDGGSEWLTLPLSRQPRGVLIRDLAFAPDARHLLDQRLRRHAWFHSAAGPLADRVRAHLLGPLESPLGFLESGLRLTTQALGFNLGIRRSSSLSIDPAIRGQDRVIAIAHAVGAGSYLNPPGGVGLYDAAHFAAAGLELRFLVPYSGRFMQMLPAMMRESSQVLREDVLEQSVLMPSPAQHRALPSR